MVMFVRYEDFVDLNYKPKEDELIAEYLVTPAKGVSFKQAAGGVAAESSVGTWTELTTMTKRIERELAPHVFQANSRTGLIKIAYSPELFEPGNMPQIFSSIAGNVFSMKIVDALKLEDIHFPPKLLNSFKGPAFGIPGIRKIMKIKNRPLLGTIIKPKLGLREEEHAKVAFEAWMGGLQVVKDDENLSNMSFNNFEKRIRVTLKARDKAERETGEKKIYLPNVTADFATMVKRAKFVKSLGGEFAMVDVVTIGFSALQALRDSDLNLALHAHRAMHAALTRNPRHGVSMLALAKAFRLLGVDSLHIGTAFLGKMSESGGETISLVKEVEQSFVKEEDFNHVLAQDWGKIKPVLGVCSGGLHPGLIPGLVKLLGTDLLIQFGGGVHGNKLGTHAGAMAARQALDATLQGINLREHAKTHKELKCALDQWGTTL